MGREREEEGERYFLNQIRRFGSTANRSISNRHHIYDKISASTVFLQIFASISFGIFFTFQNGLTSERSDGFESSKGQNLSKFNS